MRALIVGVVCALAAAPPPNIHIDFHTAAILDRLDRIAERLDACEPSPSPPPQVSAQRVPAAGELACRWACSDPVCAPECTPECTELQCHVRCDNVDASACGQPVCETHCDATPSFDYSECPRCEPVCEPLVCSSPSAACEIVCAEPACAWQCRKPVACPPPQCELQCEQPACFA